MCLESKELRYFSVLKEVPQMKTYLNVPRHELLGDHKDIQKPHENYIHKWIQSRWITTTSVS